MRHVTVLALLVGNGALAAWVAMRNSPNMDEVGHLGAGVYLWHFGRCDVYRVNPPLVRGVAALPVVLSNPKTGWGVYQSGLAQRPEWTLGREFILVNHDGRGSWFWYFVVARWGVIPLSVFGGYICYRWASELYGRPSGILALVLWCFSPNVLAWAPTICPDAPATALGAAAGYVFWRWLREPTWPRALGAGIILGIVELTKFTWIVLFPLWPALWILWRIGNTQHARQQARETATAERGRTKCRQHAGQISVILLVALYVINTGYGFEGSFRRLGEYTFVSRTLAGKDSLIQHGDGGNGFANTWLGSVPVPLPENYLGGIDLQKLDFEQGKESYLRGQWKHGGWWYYYIYGALLKVPLGTWTLGLLALAFSVGSFGRVHRGDLNTPGEAPERIYSAGWRNEMALLAPAIAVFVLVSSQTGFSRYFRYVLPCFPFAFIWISKVARSITLRHWTVVAIGAAALAWSVGSSLWCYPHSMSYFNELAGGATGGHYHLVDANIDWGQDMWYLKRWLDAHPEARPLHMAYLCFVHPRHFGIEYERPPEGPEPGVRYAESDGNLEQLGPRPGWYAMSVHRIHSNTDNYLYFLRFRPVAMAGYSIYIYHITPEEANRVRRDLGLPELKEP